MVRLFGVMARLKRYRGFAKKAVAVVEKTREVVAESKSQQEQQVDFGKSDVGQGKGCLSFTNISLDVIQQADGVWMARSSNWGVAALGATDLEAIQSLWAYLKARHPSFVLPEHLAQ